MPCGVGLPAPPPPPGPRPRRRRSRGRARPPGAHRRATRPRARRAPRRPVARTEIPRGPVRRTTPRTSRSQEWKIVAAYGPWTSSKKVASTGPVASSRVRKTTRRPSPDRRGLGRDLDPGDPHLAAAAAAEQVPAADHPERVEHRAVELDDVRRGVEAEDVELGPDPLGAGHLGQAGAGRELGPVAEVEGELDRLVGGRDDRSGRLRLRRRPLAHQVAAEATAAGRGDATTGRCSRAPTGRARRRGAAGRAG